MSLSFVPDFDLQSKNSLAVPSRCRWFASVSTPEHLSEASAFARQQGLPLVVIGSGTNVLMAEQIEAVIVQMSIMGKRIISRQNCLQSATRQVEVSAGENWHRFVFWCLQQKLYGIENLALIPGTCGAAPIQNIGAYGTELDQFVDSVEVFDLDLQKFRRLSKKECEFGYRDSVFKRGLSERLIVVSLRLTLSVTPEVNLSYPALSDHMDSLDLEPTPEAVFEAVCAIRRTKLPDPKDIPNVGSFFKNPVIPVDQLNQLLANHPLMPNYAQKDHTAKIPAAWLIDQAGWKGHRDNGVGVHDKQALVLVNPGAKPIAEVLSMAIKIQHDVHAKFGIKLDFEPRQISI